MLAISSYDEMPWQKIEKLTLQTSKAYGSIYAQPLKVQSCKDNEKFGSTSLSKKENPLNVENVRVSDIFRLSIEHFDETE